MAESLSSELSDPPLTSPTHLPSSYPPNRLFASSPPADQSPLHTQRVTVPLISDHDETPSSPVSEKEQTQKQHHCDCCGRRRRSNAEKLGYIFTLLRTWRWTFTKLLDMLSERQKRRKYLKAWSSFESYIRNPQSAAFTALSDIERQRLFDAHFGWNWVTQQLRQELGQVSNLAVFGEFNVQNRMENIKFLEDAASGIENAAPHLSKVLRLLDHPHWAKDKAEEMQLQPRHLLMFSIMCTSLHRKTCTNLPTLFGIYLFDGGATKRVINTCNQLGICMSYNQLRKKHLEIAKQAEKEVREVGSGPTKLILSYDNFEYQDSRAEERIESATKFMSITTAVACVPCRLPVCRHKSINQHLTIKQSIIKDNEYFSLKDFKSRGLSRNKLKQINRFFLVQAVLDTFPGILQRSVYKHDPLPKLPTIQRIPPQRTKSYPLKAIFKSESTTENTQFIVDNLYLGQLGLKEGFPEFKEDARIVVGDLKTLNLIMALKKLREDTTEKAGYDTYKWIIPNLGLFHLRMNMLQLIHGAHWGGTTTDPAQWDDASTLQWQADVFGNSRSTHSGKEVQALDQLVRHSHHARVVAVMVNVLKKFVPNFEVNTREVDRKTVEEWLSGQKDSVTFDVVINKVQERLFEPPSSIDTDPELDDEWQNHIRFIQHVRPYLLLKWSIQHADLGLIRQAMRECCVLFQAPSGGKGNYAREMIRYLQLVDSSAVKTEVADYILLNALVNPSGRVDGWYPMDQHLEFINLDIRNGLSDRRSSYDKGEWIRNNVLNIPFTRELKRGIEATFGTTQGGRHRKKPAHEDIWHVANQLQSASTIKTPGRYVAYAAPDLYLEGVTALPANVFKHNDRRRKAWDVGDEIEDMHIQPSDYIPGLLSGPFDWKEEEEIGI